MSYLTIRLPESQIRKLKELATSRRVSMSSLFEEMTSSALEEFDLQRSEADAEPNGLADEERPFFEESR